MKQEKWWALIIVALIAASVWVMVGTHYDAKSHQRVSNYPPKYGLDIKGGVRAVLQAKVNNLPKGMVYDQATVQRILENRINSSGVGEATVAPKGTDQFIVELPDVKDKNAILQQLGTTASMTFYYFKDTAFDFDPEHKQRYPDSPIVMSKARDSELYSFFDKRTQQRFRDGAQIKAEFNTLLAAAAVKPGAGLTPYVAPDADALQSDRTVYLNAAQQTQAEGLNHELTNWHNYLKSCPIILTGADIEPKSTAHMGGALGTEPAVSQVFTAKGAKEFADFTRDHTGEYNGIVLDDAVLSAPIINEPILDGQAEVSGGFRTLKDGLSLANLLNAGALPVPLEQVQTQSIEASLGAGAVRQSVFAGIIGLSLVLLFMALYYRLPGVIADIALLIYGLFTIAIFRGGLGWLGVPVFTLTLPGIAGFILSIGMAVDANILIFERVKEELRSGKSLRSSIDAGFKRAFTAIRDSNICTAITCIVLFSLGTQSVKGFALTLLTGVIVSLFSAITVTRTLLYLMVDAKVANTPTLFGVPRPPVQWNIIGRRKFFYGLSLAIIVPGLIFLLGLHGLKPSIEFTGGTEIQVRYLKPVTQGQLKSALATAGYKDNLVQIADGGTSAIVSVPERDKEADLTKNAVYQKLVGALDPVAAHDPEPKNFVPEFSNVGGTISSELTSRASQAVIIASILIVLYIASVFAIGGFVAGLRLGLSSIAALLHDVLVLLGFFAFMGFFFNWQIDSLFVTALLTVIGFSVHDTVVIFDRVRENRRLQARGEPFEALVNRSVQQTLTRSVFTSATVLLTLAALIIFGGHSTLQLNWALFVGILSGTYSSIFNAASILVDWENWLAKRRGVASPALAPAGAPAASLASNGGASRPASPLRPAAPFTPKGSGTSGNAAPTITSSGVGMGQSALSRPKKKKPARRF